MSAAPSIRPGTPPGVRMPAQAMGAPAPGTTIDPIKLLKKYYGLMIGVFLLGLVLGVGAYFALLYTFPKFTSEVTYKCNPAVNTKDVGGPENIDAEELEIFMGTQAAMMVSDDVIDKILKDPRLQSEAASWFKKYSKNGQLKPIKATEAMEKSIGAYVVRDTYYIRMNASAPDKDAALGLARLAKEHYLSMLGSQTNSELANLRDTITKSISDTTQRYNDLRARRARTIRDENLESVDADRSASREQLGLVDTELLTVTQSIEAVGVDLQKYEQMLAEGNSIQFNDTQREKVEQDPLILNFKQQIKSLEANLLTLSRGGIQPGHRDYKFTEHQISSIQQKTDELREDLLLQAFNSEVDGLRRAIGQLRAQEADLVKDKERLGLELIDLTRILEEIKDLDREMEGLLGLRDEADEQLANLNRLAGLDAIARVTVIQSERRPKKIAFPRLEIIIPATAILFTGLIGGLVVLRELVDQRVKSPADIAMIPRTRVLGMIPDASEDPTAPKAVETIFRDDSRSAMAESYRELRTKISKAMDRAGHRSLLVVGGQPKSGATSVAMNLAFALAANEQKTLLIDANFRRPSIHRVLGLPESPGLADLLSGSESLEKLTQSVSTGDASLDVLCVGASNLRIYERLGGAAMGGMLAEAADKYDKVIIDVTPASVAGDASALGNRVDASMLVVRALGEKRGMVARLKNAIADSRGEFLGVLVNATRGSSGGYMRKNIRIAHGYKAASAEAPNNN